MRGLEAARVRLEWALAAAHGWPPALSQPALLGDGLIDGCKRASLCDALFRDEPLCQVAVSRKMGHGKRQAALVSTYATRN